MAADASLGERLLGIEGLALLRLVAGGDPEARLARVNEMRALLASIERDPDLATLGGRPYDVAEGYRLWSATYDTPLRLFPIEAPLMHALFDTLPPSSVVLDAACGTGRHSRVLAARGHPVIGVDLSPEMLAKARQSVPSGQFHEGSLTALPLVDRSVDAAVCALALVHVPDLAPAMRELARVLRAGGRVVISDVHPFVVLLGWQAQFRTVDGALGFIRLHRHLPSDYSRAFAEAGLRIRGCDEAMLPPEAAATAGAGRMPDAARIAFGGLPGVIVWDLEKTA